MSNTATAASQAGTSSSRTALLEAAQRFCDAFATKSTPPAELVSQYFASSSDPPIVALEHGLAGPGLATHRTRLLPFLGSPFRGPDGVQKYFETVGGVLDYDDMRFSFSRPEGDEEEQGYDGFSPFVVDVEGRQVCVKGKARFTARESGQQWDESFIYRLGYTFEQGPKGGWKVVRFEVWADPAAAYLAAKGEL